MSTAKKRLVAVVGPTAVGKSRLGLRLAAEFDGEIVGADSRQVYRHLDIGTAKPSAADMSAVRHHLIDIINPDEDFSIARYLDLASVAIIDIHRRDRLPLLVGGSGQYVWSVLEGWRIPRVPPDIEYRRRLEQRAETDGGLTLYRELVAADPATARSIDSRNIRRVIRALEIVKSSPAQGSRLRKKVAPDFEILIIGLTAARDELYRRTDFRIDEMINRCLVAEIKDLYRLGYAPGLAAMSGVGYRQIGAFLRAEMTLTEAAAQTKTETHRLVRQQQAWFRDSDPRINWFDVDHDGSESEVLTLVDDFLCES